MSQSHSEVLTHLEALVGSDTRNPPRAIAAGSIDAYITRVLEPAGFVIAIDEVGPGCLNILATRGTPRALFNVHLDTVPESEGWSHDPLRLQLTDGKAFGLGACDVKGSAAALITAAVCTPADVPAAILFTTDEEHGSSACVRTFLTSCPDYRLVVVAEPTENRAVCAHRGLVTATFVARGTAGHTSQAGATAGSAIHRLTQWCAQALDFVNAFEAERSGSTMSGIRFNIGRIEGGTKPNMVAPTASAAIGFRPLPDQAIEDVLTPLRDAAQAIGAIDYHPGFLGPPLKEHRFVCDLIQQAEIPVSDPVDFWTEAALFAEAGLPACVLGPGSIQQAHAVDEWIAISQLEHAVDQYARLMSTFATMNMPPLET
ncbi:MAG: acetylornithine deacetylase [Planctomycetes bacterium]|nr:acetylornithine deacetylase [Planctomycetota bacterium]NOG56060.1 acetylornithine deacetylase [Planctomycetota bacterium]